MIPPYADGSNKVHWKPLSCRISTKDRHIASRSKHLTSFSMLNSSSLSPKCANDSHAPHLAGRPERRQGSPTSLHEPPLLLSPQSSHCTNAHLHHAHGLHPRIEEPYTSKAI